MRLRRCVGLMAAAIMLSLGLASAAHAADYPPTTVKQNATGSTVTTTTLNGPVTVSSSPGGGLPFTGGNDVWQMTLAGVVLVGVGGSLLVVRRRRTHAAA